MKKRLITIISGVLILLSVTASLSVSGQSQKNMERKYLTKLPSGKPEDDGTLQKYRMTALYTNMDIYGNFTGRTMVTGDYTRGFKGGHSEWNNVFVSDSKNQSGPFDQVKEQKFMENFRYMPSDSMIKEEAFKNFPTSIDNIYSRNLIWDMMGVELFAWRYNDSLKLNAAYKIPDITGKFDMAGIGSYNHSSIQLCWTGLSVMNNELCAVIEYRALNNKLEIATGNIKTKGTEQYWGATWISLKSSQIEFAEIFSSTFQEVDVQGMSNKFLMKTIRELKVERIK
ncbi:MAG: hypothetical protein ABSG89_13480 [Bacteroidales bacterium]